MRAVESDMRVYVHGNAACPHVLLEALTHRAKQVRNVDDNPVFDFQPSSYCNDPFVIAQNENVVAINSAIEIDVTGLVISNSAGTRFVSGFGGQLEFMRGAGVVTTRAYAHYVVTEYGVAYLHG